MVDRAPAARVALVTGSASGIGQATARLLDRHGFRTFGTSRSAAGNQGTIEMLTLEVTDGASVRRCIETVLARAGRIDVLVNNVGGGIAGAVEETSLAEAQALFEVNLWGAVRMTQAVLPVMRHQGGGRIVVMSAGPGLIGFPYRGAYWASKFALESLFESLRFEVASMGIHVSIVKPGAVATPAADHVPRAALALNEYREPRDRLTRLFDSAMRNGMPPSRVARTILRIATVPRPRGRYLVGMQVRAAFALQRLVPHALLTSAIARLLRPSGPRRRADTARPRPTRRNEQWPD